MSWYRESRRHSIAARKGWQGKHSSRSNYSQSNRWSEPTEDYYHDNEPREKRVAVVRIPPKWRKTTHKQFVHRDFDKDKTPNIDDRRPFDPKQAQPVDRDTRYTKEIREIERVRKRHLPHAKKLSKKLKKEFPEKKGYFVSVRRKSTPSIVNKMRRKTLKKNKIEDITGAIVVSKTKKGYHKSKRQARKLGYKIVKTEDFYKRKKKPYYKATHHDIKLNGEHTGEIQLKTERQRRLHVTMHKGHKTGRDTGPFTKKEAIERARKYDELDKRGRPIKIRKRDFWAGV